MTTATDVEADCTITHEGRTYEAGGAVIAAEYAIAYVSAIKGDLAQLTDWHGNPLGAGRVASTWRADPRCYLTDRWYQIEATLNGVRYTGRSGGAGLVWKGKRTAKQPGAAA